MNDADGCIDQAALSGEEIAWSVLQAIQAAAMVHADPEAAVAAFVQSQNRIMSEPAGAAIAGNLTINHAIEATAPSCHPDGAGTVLAYGHHVIMRQTFAGRVGSKSRRIQPIQAIFGAHPEIAFLILEDGINPIAKYFFIVRPRNQFAINHANQPAIGAHPKLAGAIFEGAIDDSIGQPIAGAVSGLVLAGQAIEAFIGAGPNPALAIFANKFQSVSDRAERDIESADGAVLIQAAQSAQGRDADVALAILAQTSDLIGSQSVLLGEAA